MVSRVARVALARQGDDNGAMGHLSKKQLAKVTRTSFTDLLRVPPRGAVDLDDYDPGATPGFPGGKKAGQAYLQDLAGTLSDLQERLYAQAHGGGAQRRVLLVVQGLDTSGKGGTMRHVAGLMDPQGVAVASFKRPTDAELRHDFLWRVARRVPEPGMVGVFDRSHYEDVLVARVERLATSSEITERYKAINAFERELVEGGTTVVKCLLHISKDEQKQRLAARLDDPTKHWKYNPDDLRTREQWDDYRRAYEIALNRCGTVAAPWFVVPADRKWYRNVAITRLLVEHLDQIDPQWPAAQFDLDEERARVAAS